MHCVRIHKLYCSMARRILVIAFEWMGVKAIIYDRGISVAIRTERVRNRFTYREEEAGAEGRFLRKYLRNKRQRGEGGELLLRTAKTLIMKRRPGDGARDPLHLMLVKSRHPKPQNQLPSSRGKDVMLNSIKIHFQLSEEPT